MADNVKGFPGFRWSASNGGGCDTPKTRRCPVATAYSGSINGGTTIDINIGDPVRQLATGYWVHAAGQEAAAGAAETIGGICMGIAPYWDGTVMTPGLKLPAGLGSYGTNEERRSFIYVAPANQGLWEVDCDDKTTATTYATYLALIGENCDHALTTGSEPRTNCLLDISTHVATTAQWRIIGISETAENKDFSGLYVKLIVACNEGQQPVFTASGL